MDLTRAQELFNVDLATTSASEVRREYHEQMRRHHPDTGSADEAADRTAFCARLSQAYRLLEIFIEDRDRNSAGQLPPMESDGWSFSVNEPDWYPKQSPPKKRRGSQPKTPSPSLYPSLGRQRGVLLLIGAIAMLSGAAWYDAVALMLTGLILGSLLMGRPLEVLGDLLAPVERLLKK
jgi:hypothetical protein